MEPRRAFQAIQGYSVKLNRNKPAVMPFENPESLLAAITSLQAKDEGRRTLAMSQFITAHAALFRQNMLVSRACVTFTFMASMTIVFTQVLTCGLDPLAPGKKTPALSAQSIQPHGTLKVSPR
jgi:hypothetical protein